MKKVTPDGGFRTEAERAAGERLCKAFEESVDPLEARLDNFPKYARRQRLTRFLSLYEIFKRALPVKGSVVECGVYRGFGLMSWANFSAILEPTNLTRRIYGFDSFGGFPGVSEKDSNQLLNTAKGQLNSDSYDEMVKLVEIFDSNRFLGHINKVGLIKGDACKTIPEFISKNRHLVVSLLFLDMDLYEPTKIAIENFLPRMPKGAVIAFDELDNPMWPGETTALLETIGIKNLKIQRLDFDPYIGFAEIG